jgi:hypothetical protein
VERKLAGAADKVGMTEQRKVLGVPLFRKKPAWGRIAAVRRRDGRCATTSDLGRRRPTTASREGAPGQAVRRFLNRAFR